MRWGRFQVALDRFENDPKIFTSGILARLVRMLAAIAARSQLLLRTSKIDNAISDRMLSPKFQERKAFAKRKPKYPLDIGRIGSRLGASTVLRRNGRCGSPHLTLPSPPPRAERDYI